jgi:hypothetical protein
LDFAVVIKVVGGVCLPSLKIQLQCSYAAVAVGETKTEGQFFCRAIGRGTLGYFRFSVGVPVKKWLTSWIVCIVWFSFFLRATDKRKKDFELCHCCRSGGGSGYC